MPKTREKGTGSKLGRESGRKEAAEHRSTDRPPTQPCMWYGVGCGMSAGSGCALVATDRAFRMRGFEGARVCVMNNEA